MRKYAVALLAVPILSIVYLGSLLRRSWLARGTAAVGIGAIVALGAMGLVRPAPTVATPPTPIVPLTEAAFTAAVSTGVRLDAAQTLTFTTPMDQASVAAALHVDPETAMDFAWDASGKTLTIRPTDHWAVGRFHTITVDAGALALTGRPLTTPVRTVFLTRPAVTVALFATHLIKTKAATDSAIRVVFDQPIDEATLAGAIRLEPRTAGALRTDGVIDGAPRYTFVPSGRLPAGTKITVAVRGVLDRDGVAVDPATLSLQTVAAPTVTRFRPANATKKVARDSTVSVRFSGAMDKTSTRGALKVTANGKPVAGKARWSAGDSVLAFDPTKDLPYRAKVVVTVSVAATDRNGTPLAKAASATFSVKAKPPPAATTTTHTRKPRSSGSSGGSGGSSGGSGGSSGGSGGSGGSSAGSATWGAVERYYFRLMNCTRTGGWVDGGGHCDSPGGRNVAPLTLSSGISTKVSRPYAKLLATRGACDHFLDGNPGDRLKRAGYRNWDWAENIGCPSGDPYAGMIAVQRYFQNEKSSNGGHWVNMMNAKYDRAGVGVWVSKGRVRVVIDFYHP